MNKFLYLVFILVINVAHAFVPTVSNSGKKIYWPGSNSIDIYLDAENSSGMNEVEVSNVLNSSVSSWKQTATRLNYAGNSTKIYNGRNDIYFSKDTSFFNGVGIVGVTQIIYRETTGEILEGDIILNDNYLFSSSVASKDYLGNALTHEIGHLLGFGHGQTHGSTMIYQLARGQHEIHSDEIYGHKSIYGITNTTGKISGKVVGGKELVSIFAAYVSLVSTNQGKVVAAQVTESDGTFSFTNVDANDIYYLYIDSIKERSVLSYYHQSYKKNYCTGFSDFRGSFYQPCQSSKRGKPQPIYLGSKTSVDLGNISIRCNLESPQGYLDSKGDDYQISLPIDGGVYGSYVGYFSPAEIAAQQSDNIKIDLSNFTLGSGNYYLQVNLIHQQLYSKAKINLKTTINGITNDLTFNPQTHNLNLDGTSNLDLVARVALYSDKSKNIVDLELNAEDLSDYLSGNTTLTIEDVLPVNTKYADPNVFYFLSFRLVKYNSGTGGYDPVYGPSNLVMLDNSSCPDGPLAYSATPFTATQESEASKRNKSQDEDGVLGGCGSITNSGSGGPPSQYLLQLIVGIFLSSFMVRGRSEKV